MAVSTVTQRQRRVSDAEVNSRSGFLQTLFGKNTAQPEPDEPNAQSRWLISAVRAELHSVVKALSKPQEPEKPQPVHGEAALYNTHPKPQLRRLAHLALDLEADPALGFRDCVERLHELMDEFSAGALDEFKAQQQYERRVGRNAVVAAAQGAVLEDAARRGEPIDPRSSHGQQVIGDVAGRALSASDPRPTELQAAMTPEVLARMDAERAARTAVLPVIESVTVAAPVSPVHAHDGIAPAIPDAEEIADPGAAKPLPKRIPYGSSAEVVERTTEAGEAS